jgi:hypothetical protein
MLHSTLSLRTWPAAALMFGLAALKASPALAADVEIRTRPAGATVLVDGSVMGKTDGTGVLRMGNLPGGAYEFIFRAEGHEDRRLPVELGSDEQRTFDVELKSTRRAGSVVVQVNHARAEVRLDERPIGLADDTGLLVIPDVAIGTHILNVVLAGYRDYLVPVSVADGAREQVNVQLVPLTQADGGPRSGVWLGALLAVGVAALAGAGVLVWRRRRAALAGFGESSTFGPTRRDEAGAQRGQARDAAREEEDGPETGGRFRYQDVDALVGRVVDGCYRVDRILGKGGMGAVFAAHDVRMERDVALKVIRPELSDNHDNVKRFLREIKIASKLSHTNIVTFYHTNKTEDGVLYIAMELLHGRSLKDVIAQDAPMLPSRACLIAMQIADALQEAHAHRVVHRDLKPGNVMVETARTGEPRVKLLDFGIAKSFEIETSQTTEFLLTHTNQIFGTPPYMSPEQCTDVRKVDHRSDIYSLGIILYEMLTRAYPYEARTAWEFLTAHTTGVPIPLAERRHLAEEHLLPQLQAVLTKVLAKDPDARYQTVAELRHDLVSAMQAGGTAQVMTGKT